MGFSAAWVLADNRLLRCELLAEYGAADTDNRRPEVVAIGDFVGDLEYVEDIEGDVESVTTGGASEGLG